MTDSFDLICSKCNFKLDNISDLYPYIILESGEHYFLETQPADGEINQTTGLSYGDLKTQKRMGEFQHFICDDCATDALIDKKRERLVCPKCKSKNLLKVGEMDQVTCPLCRYGRLSIQNNTDN